MNALGKNGDAFFFLIDFEMEKIIIRTSDDSADDIIFNLDGHGNFASLASPEKSVELQYEKPDFNLYKSAFDVVLKELNYGNSFLANLTWKTKLKNAVNLEEIFINSSAKYKLLLRNKFVVFSPECFVRIFDGKIASYPMKGTIEASIPDAENIILNDPKEKAEHNTIVDLIRNDLSIVADNVRVNKFRYTELVKNSNKDLIQVSSEIVGDLRNDYRTNIGTTLFSLLPAGSISGAPKKKTVEIIQSVEHQRRGYYTGISGYFDGDNLNSFVLIRYIAQEGSEYYYHSGGGITYMSNVQAEYNEMLQKIYVPTP